MRLSLTPVATLLLVSACAVAQSPAESPQPSVTEPKSAVTSLTTDDIQEPPVPYGGGSGLDAPLPEEPTEIDCVEAESLCESGRFACDDISDFCDIGPDGLGELPDEYDWDGG